MLSNPASRRIPKVTLRLPAVWMRPSVFRITGIVPRLHPHADHVHARARSFAALSGETVAGLISNVHSSSAEKSSPF